MGIFVVAAAFETILKFEMASFLVGLGSIFAQNSCITRERWGIRDRRRLHRVSCRILHMDRAFLQKFWNVQILDNYRSKASFGSIY